MIHRQIPKLTLRQIVNFHNHIRKTDYCWEWLGSIQRRGYGELTLKGKRYLAHRVSYFIEYGSFDESLNVLHECDNRSCVFPKHLFIGTLSDNTQDMLFKGRNSNGGQVGSKNSFSKLTEEDIPLIRQMSREGYHSKQICQTFNVYHTCIEKVLRGATWSHVK